MKIISQGYPLTLRKTDYPHGRVLVIGWAVEADSGFAHAAITADDRCINSEHIGMGTDKTWQIELPGTTRTDEASTATAAAGGSDAAEAVELEREYHRADEATRGGSSPESVALGIVGQHPGGWGVPGWPGTAEW